MKLIKFPLGQLQANCYLITKDNNCLIIDPADEASFILEEIMRRKLKLLALLATHGHFDHLIAAGEIQRSFNIPLYILKKDLFLIKRLNVTAKYFLKYNPYSLRPKNIKYLKEDRFTISCFSFNVIYSPGHTPGSCCFYFPEEKIIFTGDTLFKNSIGRYDFSYSNKNELKKSINKIFKLPLKTIIYPGHGEKTVIKETKKIWLQL